MSFSRRRIASLLAVSMLCCLGVPLVSWVISHLGTGLVPHALVIAGILLMCLTIPIAIIGSKQPSLRWLSWLAVLLNTIGSGLCSAAYTIHKEATQSLSEAVVPATIPAALLLLLLILDLLLPGLHRDAAAGGCAIAGLVALITVILGWCKADEPLFFAGCFFSLIMTEALVIALVYACNDPRMTGTAYAIASCCYLAIIAAVVLILLACASGSCDCDCCDGCDCGSGSGESKGKKKR